MREHRFAVGQKVRVPDRSWAMRTADLIFTVIGKMPEKDRSPQYRIRSDDERHERVVTEDMIEAIAQEMEIVDAAEQLFARHDKPVLPDN